MSSREDKKPPETRSLVMLALMFVAGGMFSVACEHLVFTKDGRVDRQAIPLVVISSGAVLLAMAQGLRMGTRRNA